MLFRSRDAFAAAMDAVPRGIDRGEVEVWLASQPGVSSVHHLHIWSLGAGGIALTAHLVRRANDDHDAFIERLARALDARFGINHPTLQVERDAGAVHGCEHTASTGAPHGHAHD